MSITMLLASCFLPVLAQEKPEVKWGGAVRLNYNYSDWKEGNKKRGGDFGFDVFRLNVLGEYKNIMLDAEHRLYAASSGGGMLKHGWMGYRFDNHHQVQLGLTAVPFGIMPYTANSYFFNINYYLGLEDDADMGIKYLYTGKQWDMALAFFKNADVLDFSEGAEPSPNRYAYDIGGRNKETNQGNIRVAYRYGNLWKQEAGVSAMLGGIYNLDTKRMGSHAALAVHYLSNYKNWDFKAQYTLYRINVQNKADEKHQSPVVGAYGSSYEIASKADTYTASLAYTFLVDKGILDHIRVYNDFSFMHKYEKGFHDSYMNVTGCSLKMGPVYTYIDYALGKNQAWLGDDWNGAFAAGLPSAAWNARLNINVGYYF
ncbi:hypothetical protein [Bacteroides nordii]|uniref:hypothetical protein n=1 Tax=Bacteroides nordii TaxID=291645 RepID=UPI003522A707